MPTESDVARGVNGLMIFLFIVAWYGGTIAFFVAALAESVHQDCQIGVHDCLVADYLVLGSVACACGIPLLAALVLLATDHGLATVLLLALAVFMTLVYGRTVGVNAVRDIHRIERSTSVPVPSNNCQCYSGGSCDCPGG